jgi:phospholipase C
MESRRDFLKKALLLGAGGSVARAWPASIQRAFAIDPPRGTSYLDAEHVVILMQENRSFDHTFGSLQGVRGFNDPRVITLPDGNPVWLQTNMAGDTFAPFRLNIKDTKVTWMGSLPHGRSDQLAARNDGKHNGWLDAKKNGKKEYAHVPLTMGYYTRDDIPYYYALADAFTVCDQNFCSSLTPTIPNRLHLWTGTVRAEPSMDSKAHVNNEDTYYDSEANWKTFPERLEERGISWRIYQNEISVPSGLEGEDVAWLGNFEDNPLEWFTQYRVRFAAAHQTFLAQRKERLTSEVQTLRASSQPRPAALEKSLSAKQTELEQIQGDMEKWSAVNMAKFPPHELNLHRNAFTINDGDPDYRRLSTLAYREGDAERQMQAPKGDVLHQFREDVRGGNLPAVSWIVPPERFSDHPSSPWYGAWYLSETFDILTQNPEVWKKTIFILCYDENDGYFDHVPPFVPPRPDQPGTGKVSAGIDSSVEHVSQKQGDPGGPIGLGFRVPLLIASPWSRGGCVCSQVFDHTSLLMFLENFLSQKTGQPIRETNITQWRRTVCGDLTAVFRPYDGEKIERPDPVDRTAFLGLIHEARHKPEPATFKNLSTEEAAHIREHPASRDWLPSQEKGARPSCGLPYELAANGALSQDGKSFIIQFAAGNELFGARAAGSPFHVYSPVKWRGEHEAGRAWDYAVSSGDRLSDTWAIEDFENGVYHLRVHGPNGFFREFHGNSNDPGLDISLTAARSGDAVVRLANRDAAGGMDVWIDDLSYGAARREIHLGTPGGADGAISLTLHLAKSQFWYDFRVSVPRAPGFWQRHAGRIETGREGFTDPVMGRVSSA